MRQSRSPALSGAVWKDRASNGPLRAWHATAHPSLLPGIHELSNTVSSNIFYTLQLQAQGSRLLWTMPPSCRQTTPRCPFDVLFLICDQLSFFLEEHTLSKGCSRVLLPGETLSRVGDLIWTAENSRALHAVGGLGHASYITGLLSCTNVFLFVRRLLRTGSTSSAAPTSAQCAH